VTSSWKKRFPAVFSTKSKVAVPKAEVLGQPQVIAVFLDVSAKTAWERICRAGELPPFLKTENPEETHRLLHERRASAYRQLVSLVINAEGKSPGEVAKEIKGKCLFVP
jgi:shikimate kinase